MKRLLAIVKHAVHAILERPFRYIPIFIELCVACVVFGMVSMNLHKEVAYSSVMQRVAEHSSIFLIKDRSNVPAVMSTLTDPSSEEHCLDLYDYITSQANIFIHLNTAIRTEKGKDENVLQVNSNFFKLYFFEIGKGRRFSDEEWQLEGSAGMIVPVIVGSNREKDYPVGAEFMNSASNLTIVFKVIGVFSDRAFYMNPTITYDRISLKDSIVSPWFPLYELNNGYRNVNLFHIMQIETEDRSLLGEIAERSKDLGLFDLDFSSYDEQISDVTAYYSKTNRIWIIILLTILGYCLIGSILLLLDFIQHHMKEFAIYMFSGANKADLCFELLIQIAIPMAIGLMISFVTIKSLFVFLDTVVFGLVILFGIWFIPGIRLSKEPISEIIKRSE